MSNTSFSFWMVLAAVFVTTSFAQSDFDNRNFVYDPNSVYQHEKILQFFIQLAADTANRLIGLKLKEIDRYCTKFEDDAEEEPDNSNSHKGAGIRHANIHIAGGGEFNPNLETTLMPEMENGDRAFPNTAMKKLVTSYENKDHQAKNQRRSSTLSSGGNSEDDETGRRTLGILLNLLGLSSNKTNKFNQGKTINDGLLNMEGNLDFEKTLSIEAGKELSMGLPGGLPLFNANAKLSGEFKPKLNIGGKLNIG